METADKKLKEISFIIPIYNEEIILKNEIEEMVKRIYEILPNLEYEILLVENGSKDNTLKIARELEKKYSQVRVISLSQPSYGKAVKEGIVRADANYIALFNIDFWNVDFVKNAFYFIKNEEADIIVGSKTMRGASDKRPIMRRLITKVFNKFLRIFFDFAGTDTHGLKVFKKETLLPIVYKCKTEKEIFDTELLIRAQKAGSKFKELPVAVEEKRKTVYNILRRVPRTIKDLIILKLSL